MPDLFPEVPVSEMLTEVARELKYRSRVYPREYATGRLRRDKGERQNLAMEAIYNVLELVAGDREFLDRHKLTR